MLKKKAEEILMKIGMHTYLSGFEYIVEVMQIYDKENTTDIKMTAIYDEIARRRGVTGTAVERCIRHAIQTTRDRNRQGELLQYYIGDETTNGGVLTRLYRILKLELAEDLAKGKAKPNIEQAEESEVMQALEKIREKLDMVYNCVLELCEAKQGKGGGLLW